MLYCIPKTWIPIFKSYLQAYIEDKTTEIKGLIMFGFFVFLKSWKLGKRRMQFILNCPIYWFLAIYLILVFLQAASKIQNKNANWSVTFSDINTVRFMVYGQIQRECLPEKLTTPRKPFAQRVSTIKMTKILYVIVISLVCFVLQKRKVKRSHIIMHE